MNTRYSSRRKATAGTIPSDTPANMITSSDKLLSSEQVASMVGKSEAWLARKRWEGGGIPYRKIGRHVRYQLSVVLAWLNHQPERTSTSNDS
jgi:predicted DNA-binding transcriptional regulator AlpA